MASTIQRNKHQTFPTSRRTEGRLENASSTDSTVADKLMFVVNCNQEGSSSLTMNQPYSPWRGKMSKSPSALSPDYVFSPRCKTQGRSPRSNRSKVSVFANPQPSTPPSLSTSTAITTRSHRLRRRESSCLEHVTLSSLVDKKDSRVARPRRRSLKRYENSSNEQRGVNLWARTPERTTGHVPTVESTSIIQSRTTPFRARSSLVALCMESPERVLVFRTVGLEPNAPDHHLVVMGEYLHTTRSRPHTRLLTDRVIQENFDEPVEDEGQEERLLFFGSSHALKAILREKEARRLAEEQLNRQGERRLRRWSKPQSELVYGPAQVESRVEDATLGTSANEAHCNNNHAAGRIKQALTSRARKALESTFGSIIQRLREQH